MILVSSCLCGENCKYNGSNNKSDVLLTKYPKSELLQICPEVLGGLSIPRDPSEIQGGTAQDVLNGKARIITNKGQDVTNAFLKGAYQILELAKNHNIQTAILKANSPSCGKGQIYDGTFTGTLIPGNGILAELLQQHHIHILTEKEL